ncbi:MAG TPA: serine/threonine-protein kinase [Gemmatimonadales bacterium]|nr:serine/threonine-protein kinase [Gemmatimonadales bacterium]
MLTLHTRLEQALSPRYTDFAELASGGMGVVFRARDVTLDRPVAIKVLVPELATAAGATRFRREAQILARLSHPNIVPVHAADEVVGLFYYVMDLVEGETLGQRLEKGPLDTESVLQLARELLSALARVHRAGVIHRDIKPDNVFLADGRAMLADFGVAQWDADADTSLTRTSDRPGTPSWMAPEQLRGAPVTPRTDLYAVGMVLFEATTGRRWDSLTTPDRADWSGVPWPLSRALRRALEPVPADRWPDAAAFARALEPRTMLGTITRVSLAAGLVLLAVAVWPGTADSPALPADLSIGPFEEGDSAELGRRLAKLVGNRLEWYPRWTMTPTLLSFGPDAPSAAHRVGGALLRRGEGWTMMLTVRTDNGRRLLDEIEVPGNPADQLGWSRAAAESLVVHLFPREAREFRELTGRTTRNLQAERELLTGNDAFQLDNLDSAEAHYQSALRLDPGFAQAAWQLMLVRRWQREPIDEQLREFFAQHGDDLPVLYREVTRAQLDPDLVRRQASLVQLAEAHPDHGLVGHMAADELFHRGPLTGVPLSEAVARLAAVGGSQSYVNSANLYDEAAWGYIRLGQADSAKRQMAKRRNRTGGDAMAESRHRGQFIQLAWDARFRPWLAALKSQWLVWRADAATTVELARYLRVGLMFDVPELQQSLARALVERGETDAVRHQGLVAGALASLMLGQWTAGLSRLDSYSVARPSAEMQLQQAEWRLLPELLGLPPRPDVERQRAMVAISAIADTGSLAPRAAWTVALLALDRGDTLEFHRRHHAVHRAATSGAGARRLDILLHAYSAASRSQPDSALILSTALFETDSAGRLGGPFARAMLYVGRGEWYTALGRHRDADRSWLWYTNTAFDGWPHDEPQAAEVDAVLGPAARLRRALASLQLGNTTAACEHVHRVRELWHKADSSFTALLGPFTELGC